MSLKDLFLNKKLSQSEQLYFAQQVLALVHAGLPLLNSIEILARSAPSAWQGWLNSIYIQLQKGESFSQCLHMQTEKFSPEFINLIRVSERSGDLGLALHTIATQLEAQIELRRKVLQSLTYPLITLGTSCALVIIMMLWVVPVFTEVFDHFQAELPKPTKILILSSQAIQLYFLELVLLSALILGCFSFLWFKFISIQRYCDQLILRTPFLGNLFRLASLSNWCRTLGHLLEAGLALPDALRVTAQSCNDWVSHDLSAEIFKHLTRGWPVSEALKRADPHLLLLDSDTVLLLHIGAEGGSLNDMLSKRANALSLQLGNKLNSLSQSLEPFLILLVGSIIGGLVIILYLPIFNLGHIV